MPKIPANFLKSKSRVISRGNDIMQVLVEVKGKDAKSNRNWDDVRQAKESKHILKREILRNLALGKKEKALVSETIEIQRQLDALFAQSIKGESIPNSDALRLVSTANINLRFLNQEHLEKVKAHNPFIRKTLDGIYESLLKSTKRQVVSPEIVRQMKMIVWEATNQKIGYDIFKELEDIRKKISHH